MKQLSIFTIKEKEIVVPSTKDKITIWFFGDVHRDTKACDVDRWKWFLTKAKELSDPEFTYYMCMGDTHDFASYREQQKIKSANLHQQTIESIEELIQKRNRHFCQEIKQMRGKLLGFIEGNHSWVFENGVSSTEDLASRMETEYLGWLTFFTLKFRLQKSVNLNYYIAACHGRGGGKLIGTSINQVADMKTVFPSADLFVAGHNHDRGAWPSNILLPHSRTDGTTQLKQKRQFIIRSGSFMKAYETGEPSYAVSRLMRPADLGAIRITIGFHQDRKDNRYIVDTEAHV